MLSLEEFFYWFEIGFHVFYLAFAVVCITLIKPGLKLLWKILGNWERNKKEVILVSISIVLSAVPVVVYLGLTEFVITRIILAIILWIVLATFLVVVFLWIFGYKAKDIWQHSSAKRTVKKRLRK